MRASQAAPTGADRPNSLIRVAARPPSRTRLSNVASMQSGNAASGILRRRAGIACAEALDRDGRNRGRSSLGRLGPADAPHRAIPAYAPVYAPTLTYDWTGVLLSADTAGGQCTTSGPITGSPEERGAEPQTASSVAATWGCRSKWSWIVLGAEATLPLDGSTGSSCPVSVDTSLSSNVRNLLLVSGKFGWAWENALGYFKGGYATGRRDFRTTMTSTGALRTSSSGRENGGRRVRASKYALWNHIIIGSSTIT